MSALANIGQRGRRQRFLIGVAALAVAVTGLVVLAATGAHRAWRIALFLPFWLGALGLAQARARA